MTNKEFTEFEMRIYHILFEVPGLEEWKPVSRKMKQVVNDAFELGQQRGQKQKARDEVSSPWNSILP